MKMQNIKKFKKDIENQKPIAVLSPDYFANIKLEMALVADITNIKSTSTISKFLSKQYPLPHHQHLKRIRCKLENNIKKLTVIIKLNDNEILSESEPAKNFQTSNCNLDTTILNTDLFRGDHSIPILFSNNDDLIQSSDILAANDIVYQEESKLDKNYEFLKFMSTSTNNQIIKNKYEDYDNRIDVSKNTEISSISDISNTNYDISKTCSDNQIIEEPSLGLLDCLKLIFVPSSPPLTRKQFEEANNYWPCSFREEKRIEKLIAGDIFNNTELDIIGKNMQLAVEQAKYAISSNKIGIGCVIVDPKNNIIIGTGYDNRDNHPLHHAVINCINMVAETHLSWHANGALHDGFYLCTSYDAYITVEPCMMCSMALLHSRISRVFYMDSHKDGFLGSSFCLHTHKPLNHHFQVYKNVQPLEICQQLIDQDLKDIST